MDKEVISFIRQKDYKYIKAIGRGGLGRTVLLQDPEIDEVFVCKKYEPIQGIESQEYYKNFVNEIKCLFLLYHRNIVRVFNYYLYPTKTTGYILMEYIKGVIISEYIEENPEAINDIFIQTIEGFKYLEERKILHRDIRNENILVNSDGVVKIIDFGFGKQIEKIEDFNKSISLNWWCPLPADFTQNSYTFKTEIYFIGMLFKYLIQNNNIDNFNYFEELKLMTKENEEERIESFDEILLKISGVQTFDQLFDPDEIKIYQDFAQSINRIIATIDKDIKFNYDTREIVTKLYELYNSNMLEDKIYNLPELVSIFLSGRYSYRTKMVFPVDELKEFLQFFRGCSNQKQKIILKNLYNRIQAIEKFEEYDADFEDDIPF